MEGVLQDLPTWNASHRPGSPQTGLRLTEGYCPGDSRWLLGCIDIGWARVRGPPVGPG